MPRIRFRYLFQERRFLSSALKQGHFFNSVGLGHLNGTYISAHNNGTLRNPGSTAIHQLNTTPRTLGPRERALLQDYKNVTDSPCPRKRAPFKELSGANESTGHAKLSMTNRPMTPYGRPADPHQADDYHLELAISCV